MEYLTALRPVNPTYLYEDLSSVYNSNSNPSLTPLLSPSGLIWFPSVAAALQPKAKYRLSQQNNELSVHRSIVAPISQAYTEPGCTRAALFTAHNSLLNINSTSRGDNWGIYPPTAQNDHNAPVRGWAAHRSVALWSLGWLLKTHFLASVVKPKLPSHPL